MHPVPKRVSQLVPPFGREVSPAKYPDFYKYKFNNIPGSGDHKPIGTWLLEEFAWKADKKIDADVESKDKVIWEKAGKTPLARCTLNKQKDRFSGRWEIRGQVFILRYFGEDFSIFLQNSKTID